MVILHQAQIRHPVEMVALAGMRLISPSLVVLPLIALLRVKSVAVAVVVVVLTLIHRVAKVALEAVGLPQINLRLLQVQQTDPLHKVVLVILVAVDLEGQGIRTALLQEVDRPRLRVQNQGVLLEMVVPVARMAQPEVRQIQDHQVGQVEPQAKLSI